ncbi:hypothetical protein DI272_19025 [Streptomyces sp. Act143]|uniref:hypothetical protein n=1 Tax=Streptomyces sp. Act143 TaxID=2200760 RepID=UPI000D67AA72|nr:hypothetical protein [Streptomyces sp. Act143]PWI16027.1 hypothetical protein DI272_19025 [Streptomyces sp. Act143]
MTDSFDPQQQPQPRVPGVRYRTETRTRQVPSQVFGEEVMDEEEYDVDVPVPPRDWDVVLMRFLMAVALGMTAVAAVWSTASISRLLGLVVASTAIAIAAASLFELLWIVCLVAEHLLRGQPDRAEPMKKAGWFAVLCVVAAVVVEGFHEHEQAAGIVGGAVSLMAKGSWWVVFRVRQVKLRRPIAMWLQRKMEDTAAAEALLGFKQRIGGRQAYAALVFGEDEFAAAQAAVQAAGQAQPLPSGQRPDASGHPSAPVQQPAPAPVAQSAPPVPPVPPGTGTSAPAQAAAPAPAPAPVPAPSPALAPSPAPAPTPAPQAQPAGQAAPSVPPVPPVAQLGTSIAATVRAALDKDEDMADEDLVEHVRQVHGDRAKLAETVATYRRKEMKKRRKTA